MSANGEKTEEPTPKRLKKSREDGRVAKSHDFAAVFILFAGVLALLNAGWIKIAGYLKDSLSGNLRADAAMITAERIGFRILMAILIPVTLMAVFSGFVQTRGLFSIKTIKPKMERLDPVRKLKQIISKKSLFELIKIFLKLSVIFIIFIYAAASVSKELNYYQMVDYGAIPDIYKLCSSLLLKTLIPFLLVIGIMDFIYQKNSLRKELMMTKAELKEEFKEDEGNPETKGRRRQLHHEISAHNLRESVMGADFVVVNPSHMAVAVKYDEKAMSAP
ncbi:MAG TPA: EscU/YscU/HrcU family type III secretion system export apparatus switch protein, partial [bacterium]